MHMIRRMHTRLLMCVVSYYLYSSTALACAHCHPLRPAASVTCLSLTLCTHRVTMPLIRRARARALVVTSDAFIAFYGRHLLRLSLQLKVC